MLDRINPRVGDEFRWRDHYQVRKVEIVTDEQVAWLGDDGKIIVTPRFTFSWYAKPVEHWPEDELTLYPVQWVDKRFSDVHGIITRDTADGAARVSGWCDSYNCRSRILPPVTIKAEAV